VAVVVTNAVVNVLIVEQLVVYNALIQIAHREHLVVANAVAIHLANKLANK